jgi:tRNA threonylcarbamoyladenosine biosynthesis protein TsaE
MTRAIAAALFRELAPPRIVLLDGDLGAGKTTFAKGFIGASGVDEREVKSPTFAIARTHGDAPPIHHLDLYRIDDEGALVALGIEDLLHDPQALVLVEWASRLPALDRSGSAVRVEIEFLSIRRREIRIMLPLAMRDAKERIGNAMAALVGTRVKSTQAGSARGIVARRKRRTDVDR